MTIIHVDLLRVLIAKFAILQLSSVGLLVDIKNSHECHVFRGIPITGSGLMIILYRKKFNVVMKPNYIWPVDYVAILLKKYLHAN